MIFRVSIEPYISSAKPGIWRRASAAFSPPEYCPAPERGVLTPRCQRIDLCGLCRPPYGLSAGYMPHSALLPYTERGSSILCGKTRFSFCNRLSICSIKVRVERKIELDEKIHKTHMTTDENNTI